MSAPLRGTQSLVGQMGWVFAHPSLTALEILWRWTFGLPFVIVVLLEAIKILIALPPDSTGLTTLDPQNPWVAAVQLGNVWTLYQSHVAAVLHWLLPTAAVAWVIVSGLGRSLVLKRMIFSGCENGKVTKEYSEELPSGAKAHVNFNGTCGTTKVVPCYRSGRLSSHSAACFRPFSMIVLQAAWLALFAAFCFCWLRSIQWVASAPITPAAEPDLIGYSMGVIFLSLGFFTAWALLSWPLSIAPLVMLFEDRSPLSALGQSLRLGKPMTAKLVEINLVMGIVKLALIVLR